MNDKWLWDILFRSESQQLVFEDMILLFDQSSHYFCEKSPRPRWRIRNVCLSVISEFFLSVCCCLFLVYFYYKPMQTIFAISGRKVLDQNGPYINTSSVVCHLFSVFCHMVKWIIYKHVSDKSKKCLSVGNFCLSSSYSVAHLQPTLAYVEA